MIVASLTYVEESAGGGMWESIGNRGTRIDHVAVPELGHVVSSGIASGQSARSHGVIPAVVFGVGRPPLIEGSRHDRCTCQCRRSDGDLADITSIKGEPQARRRSRRAGGSGAVVPSPAAMPPEHVRTPTGAVRGLR